MMNDPSTARLLETSDTPARVGRYRVLSRLGGRTGQVFAAHDPVLGRSVVLKRLERDAPSADDQSEHRLHAKLVHDNIARVYDLVRTVEGEYLVSEYVDGDPLDRLIAPEQPPIDYERGLVIAHGVAKGLAHAHSSGVLHRDLKPQNVLVGRDAMVKLIDFGLSRPVSAPLEEAVISGSLRSMSPEQTLGRELDFRSDLFSFGVLVYELFSGQSPFATDERGSWLDHLRSRPHRPLREVSEGASDELSELVDRLLAKSPHGRPDSAEEVTRTLESLLDRARATTPPDELVSRQVALVHAGLVPDDALGGNLIEVADFHHHARGACERLGGTVVSAVGNEILVCFGFPRSHDNNAERGARLVEELFAHRLDSWTVRAAIEVGRVGTYEGPTGPLVVGQPIDSVIALGRAAPPGAALATWRAQISLARSYRMQPRPVPHGAELHRAGAVCYEILEPASLSQTTVDDVRLVGREHELAQMKELVASTRGCALVVSGEAGIGKTRLVRALLGEVLPHGERPWLAGATPLGQYSPYAPFDRLLRSLPVLQDSNGALIARAELGRELLEGASQPREAIAAVAHVLGISDEDDHDVIRRLSEAEGVSGIARRVAWFLARVDGPSPRVLVLEDAQWAAHASQHIIAELIAGAEDRGLLLVVTHRSDFEPPWLDAPGVHQLQLGRLDAEAAAQILSGVVGDGLTPQARESIIARADGVPLWLEELARFAAERAARGDSPTAQELVPITLRDLVQRQLESMPTSMRRTAQLAATIGTELRRALLGAVSGAGARTLQADLDALSERGILRARGMHVQQRLVFRHALVREALYELLDPGTRRALHGRVAQVLEDDFAFLADTQPELFATHQQEAGNADRALRHWYAAGRRASRLLASELACEHFEKALALVDSLDEEARKEWETRVRAELGPSLMLARGLGSRDVERNSGRLQELRADEPTPPPWTDLWQQWAHAYVTCDLQRISAAHGRLTTYADGGPPDAPLVEYVLACSRGIIFVHLGQAPNARAELEKAAALREHLLDILLGFPEQTVVVAPSTYLAWVAFLEGDEAGAWEHQEGIEARFGADTNTHVDALALGALFAAAAGDFEASRRRAVRVIEEGQGRLPPGHIHAARFFAGVAQARQRWIDGSEGPAEDAAGTIDELWESFLGWHAGVMRAGCVVYCAVLAELCVDVALHPAASTTLRGDAVERAHRAIDWSLALFDSDVNELHRYFNSELYRVRGRLLRLEGDPEGADAAFAEAHRRCALVQTDAKSGSSILKARIEASEAAS